MEAWVRFIPIMSWRSELYYFYRDWGDGWGSAKTELSFIIKAMAHMPSLLAACIPEIYYMIKYPSDRIGDTPIS